MEACPGCAEHPPILLWDWDCPDVTHGKERLSEYRGVVKMFFSFSLLVNRNRNLVLDG